MRNLKIAFLLFFLLSFPTAGRCDLEPSLQDILTVYFITDIQGAGQVQVRKEGESEWKQGKLGARLEEGDRILVGDETQVVLSLRKETLLHLDENSELTVENLEENDHKGFLSRLKLWTGDLLSDVRKNLRDSGSSFEVESGGVVCRVRGTVFEVSSHGGIVQTTVHEGIVHVRGGKFQKDCQAGQTCRTSQGKFQGMQKSPPGSAQRYEAWKRVRDQLRDKEPGRPAKGGILLPHSGLQPTGSQHPVNVGKPPKK